MQIAVIKWEDSRQFSRLKFGDEISEDVCVCVSIGNLIKETDRAYLLATTTTYNGAQARTIIAIPKRCVLEINHIYHDIEAMKGE